MWGNPRTCVCNLVSKQHPSGPPWATLGHTPPRRHGGTWSFQHASEPDPPNALGVKETFCVLLSRAKYHGIVNHWQTVPNFRSQFLHENCTRTSGLPFAQSPAAFRVVVPLRRIVQRDVLVVPLVLLAFGGHFGADSTGPRL